MIIVLSTARAWYIKVMVPSGTIGFIFISGLLSLFAPLIFFSYFKNFGKIRYKTVLVGALTWFITTQILEKGFHLVVLNNSLISQIPWVFVVYGALTAGVFEEVARYIVFKSFLKKYDEWIDGVGYGIGHGGTEAVVIGAATAVFLLFAANLINSDQLAQLYLPPASLTSVQNTLINTPSWVFLLMGVERLAAMVIQIALSLIVLYSVKAHRASFLFLAILLHALFDTIPAMYQMKLLNLPLTEVAVILAAMISGVIIYKLKKIFEVLY